MKKKKTIILLAGGWILIAFALGISREAFSLTNPVFYTLYGLLVSSMLATWYAVKQSWYRTFVKQVAALDVILLEEHDPDRFITRNEELLTDKTGKNFMQLKTMLLINLCRGYCAKGDYRKAQQKLESVKEKQIFGIQRFAYRADCAYVAFRLGENDKALAYIAKNKRETDRFKTNKKLGGLIAILHIFELIAADKPELAQAAYTLAKAAWEDGQNKEEFNYLKDILWKDEVR